MANNLKKFIDDYFRSNNNGYLIREYPLKAKSVSVAGTTGNGWGTTVIGNLPKGNLLVVGRTASFVFSSTDANITATFTGSYSVGTAGTADATLSGTEIDLIGATTITAATGKVSPTIVGTGGTANVVVNNTAGSVNANLNLIIDDASISATVPVLVTGLLRLYLIVL